MSALAAVAGDTAVPSAAAASMTLHVKHGKSAYNVDISPSATVDELKIKLETLTGVDRSMQKLMFKGALNSGQTLAAAKVKNKSKLKLIGNSLDTILTAVANDEKQKSSAGTIVGFEEEVAQLKDGDDGPWKDKQEHKRILAMGAPEGCGVGNKSLQLRLPATPLIGRGADGQPVRITFRNDMMPPQLWLQSAVRTKKIPLGSVKSIKVEDTDETGEYVIFALQLGATAQSRLFLYFIPKQFVQSLKEAIL
jgi:hypothetical protein